MKVTKRNYKKVVKELKEKDTIVYTVSGKRRRASKLNFKLHWNVKGNWELAAYVK